MKVIEKAHVMSVEGGKVQVMMAGGPVGPSQLSGRPGDEPASCIRCAMASHCAKNGRRFTVRAPEGVKAGDEVTLEMDLPSPAWAAFLLFMLPLAAALAVGGAVFGLTHSGGLGVAGGVAGAASVYLVLYLARVGPEVRASIVKAAERPSPDHDRGTPPPGGGSG